MLTRINGVAFRNQEELDEHREKEEEAKKRDHRKIGKEMGLFMIDARRPRLPLLPAQGHGPLKNTLLDYWRESA